MPRVASGKPKEDQICKPQKNGDIYVYNRVSQYDPIKRYNVQLSCKLIGKIPAGSTEMVPTRPRRKVPKAVTATKVSVGLYDILEWIGKESGIDKTLKQAADIGTALKIISIARYWMANPDRAIHNIEEWQISHRIPYEEGLSADACYSLMKLVGSDPSISQNYFVGCAASAPSNASIAIDSTTICSYSEQLADVRYGYNKDGNGLPTIKLMTLFCTENYQPIAYYRQPGNIPDVISVENAINQLSVFGMNAPMAVLDGGFFSEENIHHFLRKHMKFLMRAQIDAKWIRPELDAYYDKFSLPSNICPFEPDTYGFTVSITHTFSYEHRYNSGNFAKGDMEETDYRLYLHFYRNTGREQIEKTELMKSIQSVISQLEDGVGVSMLSKDEQRLVSKYLNVKTYAGKAIISYNDEAILKATKYSGIFCFVSNKAMDTFTALKEYRLRERTEEGFRLDKQSNDMHTTRSNGMLSLEGRLFCQFIAFSYEEFFLQSLNRLKSRLAVANGDPEHDTKDNLQKEKALLNWLNKMSVHKLLNWFDAVQETTVNTNIGKKRWRTETIERDRLFLKLLGVTK